MRTRIAVVVALIASLTVGAGLLAGPAQAAPCGLSGFDGVRTVGGRTYELHVPAGLTGTQVPLVVSLHGFSSDGPSHGDQSGWRPYANSHNFIVAFPNGNYRSWNFSQYGAADITFLRNVVADIAATWCVDPQRIHVSGHSNGAFMAQRVACDAADLFASAAEYAGGAPDSFNYPCNPSRGIGVALFHGDWDTVVPPAMGTQARDSWVARLACNPVPANVAVGEGTFTRYSGCRDGVQVTWRTYPQQNHLWPTGARQQDILDRMWAHFQAHPRP
jgi:polyhydroxybutyrate depolymerase